MRDRTRLALLTAASVLGLLVVGALTVLGLSTTVGVPWMQVVAVALLTAAGTAHGAAVVPMVFRIADPPRSRLDAPGSEPRPTSDLVPPRNSMRGGTMIGVLERAATILAIAAGEPTIIAAVVAIKAVGRFAELAGDDAQAAARMRERFLVGSLASLAIAGLWGVAAWSLVR
ncbi:hypothetical protein [Agrococcus sp. SGAir0287]|uniref:hypothetical protein n=1 Tax=Agrococcus sp. SGAir0287 TaxID=2070347 RepID=UPI0010CD3C4E|nr:hypothetical protein [Agrococcus sp. SGAir0287]QCR19588.1 hypothetical protein C1N71_09280 [Agrococcus sp. SGAir0287]